MSFSDQLKHLRSAAHLRAKKGRSLCRVPISRWIPYLSSGGTTCFCAHHHPVGVDVPACLEPHPVGRLSRFQAVAAAAGEFPLFL